MAGVEGAQQVAETWGETELCNKNTLLGMLKGEGLGIVPGGLWEFCRMIPCMKVENKKNSTQPGSRKNRSGLRKGMLWSLN